MMTVHNNERMRTAFTVSVDARDGVTTGISAADRARTVRALVDSATEPYELVRPGHVFPLRYSDGGVLRRPGHTEAAVDLARLAGLAPAGVLAEVVNDDGGMSPAQVHFVIAKYGFPAMPAELKASAFDAAVFAEPFGSIAEESEGAVPLADLDQGATTSFPVEGYVVTKQWARKYPRTLGDADRRYSRPGLDDAPRG